MIPFLEHVRDHYKKFAVGLSFATLVTSAIFGVMDRLSLFHKASISIVVYILCSIGAYAGSKYTETVFLRRRVSNEEAEEATLVEKPEDHLAYVANKFARRFFGIRRTINYDDYRTWRRRNPLIFTALVGKERDLYGYFDVFPIVDELGKTIRSGTKGEQDIEITDLFSEGESVDANYIYIATAHACVLNEFLNARLTELMTEFVMTHYPPRPGRYYLAFAATKEGAALLRRNFFILEMNREMTCCKRDLYVLGPDRTSLTIDRLSKFRNRETTRRLRRLSSTRRNSRATA